MRASNYLLVCLIFAVVGCNDYVPKPAQITACHGTFLVAAKAITGHYANMDVDSVIFSYTSTAKDADAFWQALDSAATAAKWKCENKTAIERHYERLIPKTGQQMFHSAEQVRISYNAVSGSVVVAWVQADSFDAVENFSQTGESSFADSGIWPQFDTLTGPASGIR